LVRPSASCSDWSETLVRTPSLVTSQDKASARF